MRSFLADVGLPLVSSFARLSRACLSTASAPSQQNVLPDPLPHSHWVRTLMGNLERSILVPTPAAVRELVNAIGAERFAGATVVNLNTGPGNLARFLYYNTDAKVVCANYFSSHDEELQKMCDASNGRISKITDSVMNVIEGARDSLDSVLGQIPKRPWSADPPPLLVIASNFTPSPLRDWVASLRLMTNRTGIWSYGRVPIYLLSTELQELNKPENVRTTRKVYTQLLSQIADVSVRPLSSPILKAGSDRPVTGVSLVSIQAKPITLVPPEASCVMFYLLDKLNRTPGRPLEIAIKQLAPGAEEILRDLSFSPTVKVCDLTPDQVVELTQLYDCWPCRPAVPSLFGDV